MSDKTKRIITSIVIPALLAIALVATALWANQQRTLADSYKRSTENMFRRAFTELCENMSNLQTALGKLRVVSSPQQYALILDDIWRISGSCVSLMSQIPSSHVDTAELNQFVVRVGDYAHALTKKSLSGEKLTEEDAKQIEALYEKCGELSTQLSERLSIGDVPVAVITNEEYFTSAQETQGDNGGEGNSGGENGGENSGENSGGEQYKSEENVSEFPTLIYDGPYSESAEKREPKGLSGGEIGEEEAKRKAETLTGITGLESQGESNGNIPAWDFHGTYSDGREADISISKTGGMLIWFMGSATGTESQVPDQSTADQLKSAAMDWLGRNGYANMQATYAQYYSGAAVINFAATQDDVILYNDLVKVWVDVSTKEIVGADARNYLYSHVQRQIAQPAISPEEAEARVSVNMKIKSQKLALIPLTPETECLCYEFKGTYGEDEYIVYIDAQTGAEQQVFFIVNTENGQLVI